MLPMVKSPEIVAHYAHWFESVFSQAGFIEFQRYLAGILASENKTVEGINRMCVFERRNQSSLNRWLTASPFSEAMLNQQRLALLESLPGTQMKPKGVLSIDDTLLTHYGSHFADIAILLDPVTRSYTWAHDLVNLYYSDDQSDYPVAWQLWKPADLETLETGLPAAGVKLRESKFALKETDPRKWRQYILGVWSRNQDKPGVAELYQSKLHIARELLRTWVAEHPNMNLPVTFDSWYTQPAFCRYLTKDLHLRYVGALNEDDRLTLKRGEMTLKEFADQLKAEHLKAVKEGGQLVFRKIGIRYKGTKESYYSYCHHHLIHNLGKQRLVINFSKSDLSDTPKLLISNCLTWQSEGITRIYRHRWPVEVYHEEGKAEGLDQYQVRNLQAISRHISLVAVAFSLLRAIPHDRVLLRKLQRELEMDLEGSAAYWRRVTNAESLWALALFISVRLTQGQSLHELMKPLLAAVCG